MKIFILFFLLLSAYCGPRSSSPKTQKERVDSADRGNKKESRSSKAKKSIFIVNNTNEPLLVIYNGSTPKKQSMSSGDCFSFRKRDLNHLQLNPSHCTWNCPRNLMGCRECPSQKGYYELVQRSQPYDPVYEKISDNAPDKEDCPSFLP